MNINELSDELLLKFYSYLSDREKLKMRSICSKWRDVIKIKKFIFFIVDKKLKQWRTKRFCIETGLIGYEDKSKIRIKLSDQEEFEDILKKFNNVKLLYINISARIQDNKFKRMIVYKKLLSFILEYFIIDIEHTDEFDFNFIIDSELTNLKCIAIFGDCNFTIETQKLNEFLQKCDYLNILIIDEILTQCYFVPEICVLSKRLQKLQITGYSQVKINENLDTSQLQNWFLTKI